MAVNHTQASIPALLLQRIATHGAATILRKKDRGIWKSLSWNELGARVRQLGMGLKAAGLRPGDVAGVLAETRPEWVIADLAILGAGGVSLGIPPDTPAERIGDLLRDTGCRMLFVENEEQLDKALGARDCCPALRHIVILDMTGLRDFADPACESLAALTIRGARHDAESRDAWETGIAAIAGLRPALVQLASGTPRMVTHAQVLREAADTAARLGLRAGDERLALLPMSDPLERIHGLYAALHAGAVSNYLENPETLLENLQEVQPTVLGADAAIWQRLHDHVSRAAAAATPVQRVLYRWAIGAGQRGRADSAFARILVLHAVRRELGLARLRCAYAASSPAPEVTAWAASLGIDIIRIETDAPGAAASNERHGAATVNA